MVQKTALVVSLSNLGKDPRVYRQIKFLKDIGFKVTTLGLESSHIDDVAFFPFHIQPSRLGRTKKALNLLRGDYEAVYWNHPVIKGTVENQELPECDLYVANDILTLPLVLKLAKGKKVLFDAHEYAPRELEDSLRWRLLNSRMIHHLCRTYIPKVDKMVTVCEGIAKEYSKEFGVLPSVITNAPGYCALEPKATERGEIRMIYHGMASPYRKIEDVLVIAQNLDERFALDIILIPGDSLYIEKLKKKSKNISSIRFLDPVPMHEIPHFCNQYDIGFFPLRASNFNYYHALPNKFFEFIQARVAVAVSPLPEMAGLIKKYSCGCVAPDFNPLNFATLLNSLTTDEVQEMKINSNLAAKELCAEMNQHKFSIIIGEMFASKG